MWKSKIDKRRSSREKNEEKHNQHLIKRQLHSFSLSCRPRILGGITAESHIDGLNWFLSMFEFSQGLVEFLYQKTFFLYLTKDFPQSPHPWEFRTLISRWKVWEVKVKEWDQRNLFALPLGEVLEKPTLGLKEPGTHLGSLLPSPIQHSRYSPDVLHPFFKAASVLFLASHYTYRWSPKLL